MPKQEARIIKPQPGPQEQFLSTWADIAIFGGAAGGGKSYALILEGVRHKDVKGFGGIIFRREATQITQEGGLWDTAKAIYPIFGARPREGNSLDFTFPDSFVRIKFSHLQLERHIYKHDGSQYPFIGFDELQHFTRKQFLYMLSRNRSVCGVAPYIRATCNPDPNSFLRQFIAWWIDEHSGLPIPERAGKIRWFITINDEFVYADTWHELRKNYGCKHVDRYLTYEMHKDMSLCPECGHPLQMPLSLTFIPSSIYDNPALLKEDPQYLAKLMALPRVERERLLGGNWNVRAGSGMYFQREWFGTPANLKGVRFSKLIRYWDRGAVEPNAENPDPSYTAGVLLGLADNGYWYLLNVSRFRKSPGSRDAEIERVCLDDKETWKGLARRYYVGLEVDPGQAGVVEAEALSKRLARNQLTVKLNRVRESKGKRAEPVSAQAEQRNIKYTHGHWNDAFFNEAENFNGTDEGHADQVDGLSGAFYLINKLSASLVWGRN
jgi:predicted phage terminase large subunit-like protein